MYLEKKSTTIKIQSACLSRSQGQGSIKTVKLSLEKFKNIPIISLKPQRCQAGEEKKREAWQQNSRRKTAAQNARP
jgi:hypothetical protein